jgi:hypothetical protein
VAAALNLGCYEILHKLDEQNVVDIRAVAGEYVPEVLQEILQIIHPTAMQMRIHYRATRC